MTVLHKMKEVRCKTCKRESRPWTLCKNLTFSTTLTNTKVLRDAVIDSDFNRVTEKSDFFDMIVI